MTLHFEYSENIQAGDTVHVTWGRFGGITGKVVKVMPDGGLQVARWNKSAGCYTSPKRYYRNASGRGWHSADQSDPSMYDPKGYRKLRYEFVNFSEGEEVVNVYHVGGKDNGELLRTITGAEAASIIARGEIQTPAK